MRFGITPNFGAGAIYQTTIASTDTDEEGLLCTMTGCLRSVNDDSYLEIYDQRTTPVYARKFCTGDVWVACVLFYRAA